ncbi:MAG: hypothetical protein HZB50_07105 [Chloroflexi bacterium]|nr:hypothetical protein [Chloroflexota bacterium]
MNEKPSYFKTGSIGAVAGTIGAILGAIPFGLLHYFLNDFLVKNIFGESPKAMPTSLMLLVSGLPLPFFIGTICIPIGGALFGLTGAFIGMRRGSSRLWLWGGVSGLLFNLFVSCWAL